jgi:hypothetical protein
MQISLSKDKAYIARKSTGFQAVTKVEIEQCLPCVTQLVLQVSQLAFFLDMSFEQDSFLG